MADSIPHVDLVEDKAFKRSLRNHHESHGFLMTANLKTAAIERLRTILEASRVYLLCNDDYFELIMDSGCSKICTGHETDFIPGSLKPLTVPLSMDDIAGMLTSHQKGRVQYEIINDASGLSVLQYEAYHLSSLKFRSFSPQVYSFERPLNAMASTSCAGTARALIWPMAIKLPLVITNRPLFQFFVPSPTP